MHDIVHVALHAHDNSSSHGRLSSSRLAHLPYSVIGVDNLPVNNPAAHTAASVPRGAAEVR
jgi:hypothetical protein